jgi:hypothetical protein
MDVGDWLRRISFGQYAAAFRDNGISEAVLPHLKEIGVTTVGDRRMLLAAIAALASPTSSDTAGPLPSPAQSKKEPEVSAERRPVTVMFCDLVGSTSLSDERFGVSGSFERAPRRLSARNRQSAARFQE